MKVRNVSSDDRYVLELQRWVRVDEVVEVPEDRHPDYISQAENWADVPDTPKSAAKTAPVTEV